MRGARALVIAALVAGVLLVAGAALVVLAVAVPTTETTSSVGRPGPIDFGTSTAHDAMVGTSGIEALSFTVTNAGTVAAAPSCYVEHGPTREAWSRGFARIAPGRSERGELRYRPASFDANAVVICA